MTSHVKDKKNEKRFKLLKESTNEMLKYGIREGLNTTVYKLIKIEISKLFTHFYVEYKVTQKI